MTTTSTNIASDLPRPLDTSATVATGSWRTLASWWASDPIFRHGRPVAANLIGVANRVTASFGHPLSDLLLRAHRYGAAQFVEDDLIRSMPKIREKLDGLLNFGDGWDRVVPRSIVLKNPKLHGRVIEKGVLLVTFSASFPFFRRELDLPLLLKYFTVVLEPSGAGYGTPEILFWLDYPEHPVIVEATEEADFRFLTRLKSNLIPVTFGASDWVDHRRFVPLPNVAKVYDAVYVANYKKYKRCHSYFRALAQVKSRGFKAAMVSDSWGGSRDEALALARHYGVLDMLDLYENLKQPQLNVILNQSKVVVLLSLKEGSNRSIFEGFAAGVPGIVLSENVGVNKTYLNAQTGMLVDEHDLPAALLHFQSDWRNYNPRAWALLNISPEKTTEKLAACLSSLARARGEPWSEDPVAKVNAPEVAYFDESDRARFPTSAELLASVSISRTPAERREGMLQELLRP